MKGLVLNQIYSIEKSIKSSTFFASVIVIGCYLIEHPTALKAAIFVPFLLIIQPAFEVLKHDAMSGWNIFVITLPVKRHQFIQSNYITFLLLFGLSFLLTFLLFYLADLFNATTSTETFFDF